MSTLLVSIDRSALSLSPLVLSGTAGAQPLAVASYQEPAIMHRIRYAPQSDYIHGSLALGSVLDHTLLQFDVFPDAAATESAARTALVTLRVALNQFSYAVTVTINGVAETWRCDPGSVGAAQRTYVNMHHFNVVHPVSIPCYPVRS